MKEDSMNALLRERIPQLLKDTGHSQLELAEACGVSKTTVNDWARGRSCPRPEKMRRIAAFFNIKASDLISKSIDVDLRPVKFLPLVQPDGSLISSDCTGSYGALASGIDADMIWLCPDEQMSLAGINKGDICLIKRSSAVRIGHPALIVVNGHTELRFLELFDMGLYVHTACPCTQGTLIPGDWQNRIQILGYIRAFRRDWKRF